VDLERGPLSGSENGDSNAKVCRAVIYCGNLQADHLLILYKVKARLVATLRFIYSSIQVADVLVPAVCCALINCVCQVLAYDAICATPCPLMPISSETRVRIYGRTLRNVPQGSSLKAPLACLPEACTWNTSLRAMPARSWPS
jgi:hypothetical protein